MLLFCLKDAELSLVLRAEKQLTVNNFQEVKRMAHQLNTFERPNTRVALWDNVKFVIITFVVIGHFADVFTNSSNICKSIFLFIYAFHMPLFIFISGLFYRESNSKQKIVYYASCGFALKITSTCLTIIINKSTNFSLLSESGIPWFMFSLAAFQAIMYLFNKINKKFVLVFSVVIACFVGYDKSIGDLLCLSRIIIFFPFFLLGTMAAQQTVIDFIKKHFKILLPISVFVLTLWLYLCFFQLDHFYILRHLFTGRNPFANTVIKYGPLARLLCYFITFATGASLLVIIPKQRIPIVTTLGSRTLNVYFWHWPFYRLLAAYLQINKLFAISFWGKAAYFFIAVLLSITLMSVIYFEFPLKIIKNACFDQKRQGTGLCLAPKEAPERPKNS